MTYTEIYLVAGAFLLAAYLKGITGLGFSTVSLPMLSLFLDHKLAMPLVLLPSLCSNIMVIANSGRIKEAIRKHWLLIVAPVPGLLGGLLLLGVLESNVCRVVLGAILMVFVFWELKRRGHWIPPGWLEAPVGVVTGLVNGVTGSQMMPLIPYLVMRRMERELFVVVINLSFTFSSLIMLAGLRAHQFLTVEIFTVSAFGILPVGFGIWLGSLVRRRMKVNHYRKVVLFSLLIIGLTLILKDI